jgi:DNA-binding CsgD family transcriptional regulator
MAAYIHNQRLSTYLPVSVVTNALSELSARVREGGFSGATYAFWKFDDIGHDGVRAAPSLGLDDGGGTSNWMRWSSEYVRKVEALEPVYDACRRTVMPICWGVDSNDRPYDDEQVRFPEPAMLHFADCFENTGIRNGIAVPMRGPNGCFGYVSAMTHGPITSAMWKYMSAQHRILGMSYDFFRATSHYLDPGIVEPPKLSMRERECLTLAANGMTLDGIGDELGIARSTVRYHLENSIMKLGVEKRAQAISRAMTLKLLGPVKKASYGPLK